MLGRRRSSLADARLELLSAAAGAAALLARGRGGAADPTALLAALEAAVGEAMRGLLGWAASPTASALVAGGGWGLRRLHAQMLAGVLATARALPAVAAAAAAVAARAPRAGAAAGAGTPSTPVRGAGRQAAAAAGSPLLPVTARVAGTMAAWLRALATGSLPQCPGRAAAAVTEALGGALLRLLTALPPTVAAAADGDAGDRQALAAALVSLAPSVSAERLDVVIVQHGVPLREGRIARGQAAEQSSVRLAHTALRSWPCVSDSPCLAPRFHACMPCLSFMHSLIHSCLPRAFIAPHRSSASWLAARGAGACCPRRWPASCCPRPRLGTWPPRNGCPSWCGAS